MMIFTQLTPYVLDPGPFPGRPPLAVAACLARFKSSSREYTESDLRCLLAWRTGHGLDPLAARRPYVQDLAPVTKAGGLRGADGHQNMI
jgi:hypothetical protein